MLPFGSVTLIYSFEEWGSLLERGVFTHILTFLSLLHPGAALPRWFPVPQCSSVPQLLWLFSPWSPPDLHLKLLSLNSFKRFHPHLFSSFLSLRTRRICVITFIQTTSTPTPLPWPSWAPFVWSWRSAWCPALSTTFDTLFRHLPEPLLSSWCPTLNKIHQGLPTAYRNSLNSSLGFKI